MRGVARSTARRVGAALAAVVLAAVTLGAGAACSAQTDASGVSALLQDSPKDSAAPAAETRAAAPAAGERPAEVEGAPAAGVAAAAGGETKGGQEGAAARPSNVIEPRPAVSLTPEQVEELAGLVAELRTSQGTIVLEFLPQKAPGTVQNFVELARSGFYDGTIVHRVIPGMLIQAGDPTGTGDGGPGYFIRAEINDEPHVRGTVSMSRLRHPDSAGSQFFICLAPLPQLDGGYTAFGRVLSGDDVLGRIEKLGRATPQGTPTETITLEKVLIRPRAPAERPTASQHR